MSESDVCTPNDCLDDPHTSLHATVSLRNNGRKSYFFSPPVFLSGERCGFLYPGSSVEWHAGLRNFQK